MTGTLASLLSYLLLYKYVAFFFVAYFGAIGVPLPVNALTLAVGAFSSQGYFSFWISLAVAQAGGVLGDLTAYGITRKYGEWVLHKLHIDRSRFFGHLKEELRTDAAGTVFTTRFAGPLSPIVNALAGAIGVPFLTFFSFDFLGNLVESVIVLFVGYLVGNYWQDFSNLLSIIGGIIAVIIIAVILLRMYRRMLKKYSE